MEAASTLLTVSGILFSFLFAAFWWALNRELRFEPEERHFKFGYVLLLLTMAGLGYFGIIRPLRIIAEADTVLLPSYRGLVLVLIGIFGYMLTEFGHYEVFQRQRYSRRWEQVFFFITAALLIALAAKWLLF